MEDFNIKNFEFLRCLLVVDRIKDFELYKFIEKLLYGKICDKKTELYKEKLKETTTEDFLKILKKNHQIINNQKELKIKRKNIKESMLENYVIKNKLSQQFLKELNMKILLKIIPNKNIIVENGDIIDIILT